MVLTRCCSAAVTNALEPDHHEITDQVSVNILGPSAHVFLLESRDTLANGGFDFPLRFHRDLQSMSVPSLREGEPVRTELRDSTWESRPILSEANRIAT